MKSLSKCSCSTLLSLSSLLLIHCRDDPWILACSSGWELWVMEWKRTFWKMRGHVGFAAVLFKIQHVRVFFCHCWVKLKPPFPLPLPFLLGGEKQEWLTLTKGSFGELPKAGLIPCGSWAMVTQEPVELWQIRPPAHVGKEKQELKANGAGVQRGAGSLLGVPVQPSRAGDERLWEPLSSPSRDRLPPEEQRLREAGTAHSCLFMFIWKRREQSCLGCLRQRKWISGGQLILLDYFWARWNCKMNLCPPHCLKGMYLFILHFNAPLAIYGVSLNELLIEWRCITWEINKKGYQTSKRKRKEKAESWYFN